MKHITFRNEKHRGIFQKAIEKKNQNNLPLMAALYLLTADRAVWNCVQKYISKCKIDFENIQLNNISINGYTFFCCAKDLYSGTKHLTIMDIVDRNLISSEQFDIICNAMKIRRFGISSFDNYCTEK